DVELGRLVGADGRVLLPIGRAGGKIVVESLAGRVELPARSWDGQPVAVGRRVMVGFVDEGVAWVVDLGSPSVGAGIAERARGRRPGEVGERGGAESRGSNAHRQ